MSKLRKQALIRIVICVIMLAATIVFSFLLITGKLDGTSSSASSNADSLPSASDSVEADTPESTEPESTPEPTRIPVHPSVRRMRKVCRLCRNPGWSLQ